MLVSRHSRKHMKKTETCQSDSGFRRSSAAGLPGTAKTASAETMMDIATERLSQLPQEQ